MNRIGMRAIKSALAIVICYMLYIGLAALDKFVMQERIFSKWFIPFVAAIVGFFSVSNSKRDLVKNSLHIWIVYLIVLIYSFAIMGIYVLIANRPWPDLEGLEAVDLIVPSVMVCVGVILLGYLMLICNEKKRMVNGIVLYLILVSIKFYNINFWESFAAGITSISFGVLIGFLMNLFPIYLKTYDKFLFIYGVDGIYHNEAASFDYYVKYEMQELIRKGADITLFTNRSPSSLLPVIGDLKLEKPVICMGGAALYDTSSNHYLRTEPIGLDISNQLRSFFATRKISPYISIIRDNLQYIYKNFNNNIGELRYCDLIRNNPFSNYIADEAPQAQVIFFTVILKSEDALNLINEFKREGYGNSLSFITFNLENIISDVKGYTIINIYSKAVEGFSILKDLADNKTSMAISTTIDDLVLLNKADHVITYKKAPIDVKNKADYIIKSNRKHSLVRVIKRFYYRKSSY